MQKLIEKLKDHVVEKSGDPTFIHHKWFVKYHLEIVEKIALELCDIYKDADRDLVNVLVWLHDYGKILGVGDSDAATLKEGGAKLDALGFPGGFVEKAISYAAMVDDHEAVGNESTPIEVKIISSADGAAHFVGPFFALWWHENPEQPFGELMQDNVKKAEKDWDKKIVLPEVKKAFKGRYEFLLEQRGHFPEEFMG